MLISPAAILTDAREYVSHHPLGVGLNQPEIQSTTVSATYSFTFKFFLSMHINVRRIEILDSETPYVWCLVLAYLRLLSAKYYYVFDTPPLPLSGAIRSYLEKNVLRRKKTSATLVKHNGEYCRP